MSKNSKHYEMKCNIVYINMSMHVIIYEIVCWECCSCEIASKVMENGGAYSLFPNLNITVTSAPRRSQPPTPQPSVVTLPEEEEELVEEHEIGLFQLQTDPFYKKLL